MFVDKSSLNKSKLEVLIKEVNKLTEVQKFKIISLNRNNLEIKTILN